MALSPQGMKQEIPVHYIIIMRNCHSIAVTMVWAYPRHILCENIQAFLSESWMVSIACSQIGDHSLVWIQLTKLFHFLLQIIGSLKDVLQ